MFVKDEYFCQISQHFDYFSIFKNPCNSSKIQKLAQQITPKSYPEATRDPFSYIFINLTQDSPPEVNYLSQLFNKDHFVKTFVEST